VQLEFFFSGQLLSMLFVTVNEYLGDEDCQAAVNDNVRYASGFMVKKLECTNHVSKRQGCKKSELIRSILYSIHLMVRRSTGAYAGSLRGGFES
jgi:hypothetical protein